MSSVCPGLVIPYIMQGRIPCNHGLLYRPYQVFEFYIILFCCSLQLYRIISRSVWWVDGTLVSDKVYFECSQKRRLLCNHQIFSF